MSKKIILGTAQFGMNYGIANKSGKIRFNDDPLSKINQVIIAKRIRKLQDDLGIKMSTFPELGVFEEEKNE